MTTKQLTKQYTSIGKTVLTNNMRTRLSFWKAARGIWKLRKINPVRYQRRIRNAADHTPT